MVTVRLSLNDPFNEIGFSCPSLCQPRNSAMEFFKCLPSQFTAIDTCLSTCTQVVIDVKIGTSTTVNLQTQSPINKTKLIISFNNKIEWRKLTFGLYAPISIVRARAARPISSIGSRIHRDSSTSFLNWR